MPRQDLSEANKESSRGAEREQRQHRLQNRAILVVESSREGDS